MREYWDRDSSSLANGGSYISSSLSGSKAAERDTALGYFEHNTHRMGYARFKSLGMFVGSGAVEAGCKAIVGQRLKLSGMRWSLPGAAGILTLRCLEASDRWDEIPARASNQAPAAGAGAQDATTHVARPW